MPIKNITVSAFEQIQKQGKPIALIDVLSPEKFAENHIANSLNAPLSTLNAKALMAMRGKSANDPLYVICQAGITSTKACEKFKAEGFENVINIEGGKNAWQAAGFPLEKETATSQNTDHLILGLVILFGTSFSLLIHPTFSALPLFAGIWHLFSACSKS